MTEIYLGNISIREPMTAGTDVVVAVQCFYYFYLLRRQPVSRELHWMSLYILVMGFATLTAGLIGHAFLHLLSFEWKMIGWVLSSLAVLMFQLGSIEACRSLVPPQRSQWLAWSSYLFLGLLLVVLAMPLTRDFGYVKLYAALGLLSLVLPLQWYSYRMEGHPARPWIIGSVLFGIVPGITITLELGFHTWFNHHDLAHVLMGIDMWIAYQGVKRLALAEA
ncbi:MAG: hypothetical protein OHK0039_15990 [Bacteroidia bacterium]